MKAIEIIKETKAELSPKQEYIEFCNKKFNLEITGEELVALVAISGNAYGLGLKRALEGFWTDNKDYIQNLSCYEDLMESIEEYQCLSINFH